MMNRPVLRSLLCVFVLLALCIGTQRASALVGSGPGETAATYVASTAAPRPIRVIVGFMGGRVRPDNLLHKEATVAQDLREPAAENLHVLVFANHNGRAAFQAVYNLVDQDGDHRISDAERGAATIAIYGHSWGASETVALARALQTMAIPVVLTVQVDSVQKSGENDEAIPANVHEAVNLYQRDGLLRGRAAIHAEDATRTHILLNQQYHYGVQHTVDIARFPWFARTFMRQHIMIENDPEVWARVEGYLRQAVDQHTPDKPVADLSATAVAPGSRL